MGLLADSEGPDQTVRICRLTWAFAVRKGIKEHFRKAMSILKKIIRCFEVSKNNSYYHDLFVGGRGEAVFYSDLKFFSPLNTVMVMPSQTIKYPHFSLAGLNL